MKTWTIQNLRNLHIELSNYCNAACPVCPRYFYHSENLHPAIKLNQITLEVFKKYFPDCIISNLKQITFCGSTGDPMTAKDILPILQYIYEVNSTCDIFITTNGGLRSEQFWNDIGAFLCNKPHKLTFSIDGLEDTNHIYRRNVNWDVLIRNIKAFISSGGIAEWDFLIFNHNEHQISEAQSLSRSLGFTDFNLKKPLGFIENSENIYAIDVYGKNNNFQYYISPAKQFINKPIQYKNCILPDYIDNKSQLQLNNIDEEYKDLLMNRIFCKFLNRPDNTSELYITANGIVVPCCFIDEAFIGNFNDNAFLQMNLFVKDQLSYLDLNLNTLSSILESNILEGLIINKWKKRLFSQDKPVLCSMICGKNSKIDQIYVKNNSGRLSK